jgi:predicted  nucleic acid-binding Zn-ribbon protein
MPTVRIEHFFPQSAGETDRLGRIEELLKQIKEELFKIMPSLQERFDAVNSKLQEAADEILAEITKLREGGTLTPEQEQALQNIETKANALAEISPPVETPPPPP